MIRINPATSGDKSIGIVDLAVSGAIRFLMGATIGSVRKLKNCLTALVGGTIHDKNILIKITNQ